MELLIIAGVLGMKKGCCIARISWYIVRSMKAQTKYREMLEELSPQERMFVCEYLIDGNATRAAKKARYSEDSARTLGWRLLQKVHIDAAVSAGLAAIAERCEVTVDRLVNELAAVAFSRPSHYEVDEDGYVSLAEDAAAEAAAALSAVKRKKRTRQYDDGSTETTYETEYKLWDKMTAITLLGKKLRLWVDQLEVKSPQDAAYRELLNQLQAENRQKAGDHK